MFLQELNTVFCSTSSKINCPSSGQRVKSEYMFPYINTLIVTRRQSHVEICSEFCCWYVLTSLFALYLSSFLPTGFFGVPAGDQYNLEVTIEAPGFNNTLAPFTTVSLIWRPQARQYGLIQCASVPRDRCRLQIEACRMGFHLSRKGEETITGEYAGV